MICWVTGAGGQIGTELARQLVSSNHLVIGIGRGAALESPAHRWVDWDIGRDSRPDATLEPPDVIFHLAGQTSAYQAREHLELDIQVNVLGFARVALAAIEAGAHPFLVVAGAATEIGLREDVVVSDADPDNPRTFYDVAKVVQGLYLNQFSREGWLSGCRIRLPNVYGGLSTTDTERGFLNRAIRTALAGNRLTYYVDGTYTRDFLYVSDAASALIAAAQHQESTAGESFLVGTGIGTTIRGALEVVARVVHQRGGVLVPVEPIEPPSGLYDIEHRDAVIDARRFTSLTGWEHHTNLEAGISRLVLALDPESRARDK